MKEFIEKLIGRLEEESYDMEICEEQFDMNSPYFMDVEYKMVKLDDAKEIVNQLAEEYNNGWIPCSERLPKDDSLCVITTEYPNGKSEVTIGWFDRMGACWYVGRYEFKTSNVFAWMPLPASYMPKGE